tara:strand:+ start:1559 stop:1720 length:162 start_codon:yes stop_codon:yes gene_type:complete
MWKDFSQISLKAIDSGCDLVEGVCNGDVLLDLLDMPFRLENAGDDSGTDLQEK